VTLDVGASATFHGDAGDLTEMLGNLLDNAFKWCRQHVHVAAQLLPPSVSGQPVLEITVADDGPGIRDDMKTRVLQRGARADESTPGHGLGLAMVQDTVSLYDGTLSMQASPLGGLAVSLRFPGSPS
jgi:two-component system sensor histidine kinase PhoQ